MGIYATIDIVSKLDAVLARLERLVAVLDVYVDRDIEPNILPDIKPEGRGLEE